MEQRTETGSVIRALPYYIVVACLGSYCGLAVQRGEYAYAGMFAIGAVGWMIARLYKRLYDMSEKQWHNSRTCRSKTR